MTKACNRGFTLIELMVTIVVIGILASMIIVSTTGSRQKGRDSIRISDIGQVQLALSMFYDRCGQFPTSLVVTASNGCPTGVNLGTFISQIPVSPSGVAYDYTKYEISSVPVNYVLHVTLESANVAVSKGLNGTPSVSGGTWTPTNPTTWSCSNASNSTSYCLTAN